MLASAPTPSAEEFAIFDYDGFGPVRIGEYQSLDSVSAIAIGISEHGPAFAHWIAVGDDGDGTDLSGFEEAYLGHWENVETYAENLLDDIGVTREIEAAVPDFLQPYVTFDVAAFGRDLELAGDIWTSSGDGGVYIFDGRS